MNYIVFDLEWNQNPDGRRHPDSRLPFEIIEIGAVKLNEKREIVDTFQCLIKPKVYHWIHDSIHEVIHVDYHELEKGIPFPRAIRRFLEWCGEEYRFFTWGDQDVMELQRNMKYYNLLKLMPGPVHYYDVQKLFSIKFEDGISRRSLEYATDYLQLPKNRDFHRALADEILAACEEAERQTGIRKVALSGGVFQNRLLLRLTEERLMEEGFEVLRHRMVPPNDGGIAVGQAAYGMAQLFRAMHMGSE